MKKIVLFSIIASLTLMACNPGSSSSSSSDQTQETEWVAGTEATSSDNLSENEGTVSLRQAAYIAQDIIRANFDSDCRFDDSDIRGEETTVKDRYKVLQKFRSSHYGAEKEYVYKAYMQYKGGDCNRLASWDYGTLQIEDVETGQKVLSIEGMMKTNEKKPKGDGKLTAAGMSLDVVEETANYVKVVTPQTLSRSKLIKFCKALLAQGETRYVYFHTPDAMDKEYAMTDGRTLMDYTAKKYDDMFVKLK